MHFQFKGTFPVEEVEAMARYLVEVLQQLEFEQVSDLRINFEGLMKGGPWEVGNAEAQIVGLSMDWEVERAKDDNAPRLGLPKDASLMRVSDGMFDPGVVSRFP